MQFSARMFGILVFLLVIFTRLTPFAFAQTVNPYSSLMKTDPAVSVNIATLSQGVIMGFLSSLTCTIAGIDFTTQNNQCLSYNKQTQTFGYATNAAASSGLIGMAMGGIALTYNNPLHVSEYFRYLSENFGLVKTAHAANGIGFDQLTPIMSLWIAFRNLSYLLFVLVFIAIGFAVMLRAKIDPRTVMTIENQIPKLIVALLLITFSFAIAGFVIDIMWVGIYLVINLFATLDPVLSKQIGSITSSVTGNPYDFVNTFNNGIGGFLGIAGQAAIGVKGISTAIIANIFAGIGDFKYLFFTTIDIPGFLTCIPSMFLGSSAFNTCVNNAMAAIPATVSAIVAFLIFALALLVAIFKLWWQLIKAYTLFLIFAIFGPLIIMSGVLPGSKTNFEYWIRHIVAYTIVFPTAMGIFLLGKTLMDVYSSAQIGNPQVPPLIGIPANAYAFLGVLLGFAIIMLAPQSLAMVQDALNAQDPKYLAGIGQAIGVGSQAFGSGMGKVWHRATREVDPLKKLDEGWLRRLALGSRGKPNIIRRWVEGRRIS